MLRFVLVMFSIFSFLNTAQGEEAEELKKLFKGTSFEVVSTEAYEIRTNTAFYHGWNAEVVERARRWANYAEPNLFFLVSKNKGNWIFGEIRSAADPSIENTCMGAVANKYKGKKITQKRLRALQKEMKAAYHKQFSS